MGVPAITSGSSASTEDAVSTFGTPVAEESSVSFAASSRGGGLSRV
jgi:hypothetical protein